MKLRVKIIKINSCEPCPDAYWDGRSILRCAKTGFPLGDHRTDTFPIPVYCPLPDAEDEG